MVKNFRALALSYKNTPLEIREKVALSESEIKQLLARFKETTRAEDFLILSTCNRTEFYYSSDESFDNQILTELSLLKGMVDSEDLSSYFESFYGGDNAVERLFRVSMGLEAQVVGDIQISNQVKRAYQWCADEEMAGPFLHRLMHTIFFTNKRVVQETPFRDGAASVSYASSELVVDLKKTMVNPTILVVGLGEIGIDVCRNLAGITDCEVVLVNRTKSKADDMALECGFSCEPIEKLPELVDKAQIVVSSVSANEPIINTGMIHNSVIAKYFIDLSVPRSIDTKIDNTPGCMVYGIDDIQSKASKALERRLEAIPLVEEIIKESIAEFNDWAKEMIVSPTIKKFKNALEEIRKEELARYLKKASDEEMKIAEQITKSMMQKIIKLPVIQLKAACKRGEADTLIDVLNDLFNLEKEEQKNFK
ncbi:glutamyl-tRNA reductase [Marinigracilibium pacificum]|uniref:Glutamyl-tRNA reductase n=1 Tax=Marinigracilibium pacificum TaxID=2729599 RepID=A0A848J6U1_9BACT|nr:glutamyl-tRNA reductase [Marinigracilibium pacificum]NMM48832.1 glutamyl-tRNA reductase [Marinigracilibium pacificum]